MSGIDEQCRDIPMCPICENVPRFWILYPTMDMSSLDGWVWLFSDAYIKRNTEFTKLTFEGGFAGRQATLDGIACIVCSDDNSHQFVEKQLVFQKIIQRSRRLER